MNVDLSVLLKTSLPHNIVEINLISHSSSDDVRGVDYSSLMMKSLVIYRGIELKLEHK